MKKNKKVLLYSIFTVLCIIVCVGAYQFFWGDVKGAYNPTEPYVVGEPIAMNMEVTEQDGLSIPAARPTPTPEPIVTPVPSGSPGTTPGIASSATPIVSSSPTPAGSPGPTPIPLPPIPPAFGEDGTKGQEDNPFVVLEIVSDKCLQTLTYLNTGSEPYNPVELTSQINNGILDNNGALKPNALSDSGFLFHFKNDFNVYDPVNKKMVSRKIGSLQPYYEIEATSMDDPAFDNVNAIAKADTKNWAKIKSSTQTAVKSGFLYLTTSGQGDMKITNYNGKVVTQDVQNNSERYWKYYENKADIPAGATQFTPSATDSNDINNNYIGKKSNVYFAIANWNITTITYKYTYYAIKNNDVLKHSIFTLNSEEDYDDFKMQVIAVTPQEINEMMKYDTNKTLDYIERADMIYFSDLSNSSDSQSKEAISFYYKYILGDKITNTNSLHASFGFDGNDLEWEACMKLIKRMSENINFPVLFNSGIVNNCKNYDTHVYKYVDNNGHPQCVTGKPATICNALKLFYIAVEFDLSLRKEDGYAGKRTFMEDIYPYIKKIKLKENNGTAQYTGYYQRELCDETGKVNKEYVHFLWGEYTFFPTSVKLSDKDEKLHTEYGFLKGFEFNGNLANFIGSNGMDGQNVVALKVNQTLVGGGYYNVVMPIIRDILSGLFNKATALKIQVKDSFKNGSSNLMYIDINKKANYKGNEVIKIPVTVQNSNNKDGKVTLTAVDPTTNEAIPLSATGYTGNVITIPAATTTPTTKEFVLEYPVKHWLSSATKRYPQILIQGAVTKEYPSATGPKETSVATTKFNLDLLERTLFDLN